LAGHHPSAAAYFEPSETELSAFENELASFLRGARARESDERAPGIARKLRDYRRQFVGIVVDGKRQIFGNFFCAFEGLTVTSPVSVDDGGDCFFSVVYDPAFRSFSALSINGEA